MKTWFALLSVLLTFMLTSCSGENASSPSTKEKSDVLTMSWPKDIGPGNPHIYGKNEMFAQAMLYDPLVSYGENGKIEPALATSWDISEDGKSYTFKLRENVHYSDGTTLTAENVKRNFDTVIENYSAHSWLEAVTVIDNVEVLDELTVKVHLKEAYYPFLQELTLIRPLRMLADSAFPESGTTKEEIIAPIGTGPWILTDYQEDNYAEFSRNENYWGEKPKLDKVIVKVIPDSQARIMALEKGDIDLIFGSSQLAPIEYRSLEQNGQYQTKISDPLSTRILMMNTTFGVTKDKNVRLALQHAFDRKTIIEHILNGLEKEANSLFAPGYPYSDIPLAPYPYDTAKAINLLEEAGWKLEAGQPFRTKDGETLTLKIPYNSNDQVHKAIYEYVQSSWRELGIDVQLIGEEWQLLNDRSQKGDFNIVMNDTWGVPYDPHMYIRTLIGEKQTSSYAQKGLEASQQLTDNIAKVIRSTNEEERRSLYENILQTLHEEAVFMPLSYRTNYLAANNRLQNVTFSMQQYEVPLSAYEAK
ncbi:nickel ABC transporter substrate-binding protein [Paenibacillus tarimensis]